MAFTYMLRCSDGTYYVGSTRDLELRVYQHQNGEGAAYTRHRRPVELVWHEEHENIGAAFNREKQVQNRGRAKREALIRQDYGPLSGLAKKPF
jgi:predicted GIY-YIG superfamily endonuclease